MADHLIKETVLVLGSSGYIGSHFKRIFTEDNFIYFDQQESKSYNLELNSKDNIVLNLSGSKLNASKDESKLANIQFPKNILKIFKGKSVKWVQAASYYELQVPKGRSDYYSSDKLAFREYLNQQVVKETCNLRITSLILPHVFGSDESNTRIIPTLRKMNNGETVKLGNSNQLLPILHISDAVKALHQALLTNQKLCTPKSMWHGRLSDLVSLLAISEETVRRVNFDENSENYKECELEYPDLLENFSPELSMERFVKSFKNGETI
jgi:nucleoside-diphosphate-sugar epimerase